MTAGGTGPGGGAPGRGELARVREALAAARGKRRLDLILDAPDPGALVRALPADELYFTIREIGLADAAELVRLASPSQFRTFVDLDAWRGDRMEPGRALPWLRAGRAGARGDEALEQAWRRKLAALDIELVELVLRSSLVIHDLERDPDPGIESDRFLRTPEGKFILEFPDEGVDYLAVRGLVDDLYAEDPMRAARLLEAVRWELPGELEETALRWRTGRLHDLGYPPREEALSWFARPAARPQALPGAPGRPPGFFLELRPPGSLLARAADRLPEGEREALEIELVGAANATMVADAVDPGDLDAVRLAVASSRALVELGLERLAAGAGDPAERAAEILRSTPVKAVFQQGFGRLLELRWRAEKVLAAGKGPLGPPLDELLQALARRRPLYFPGVEAPREEWGSPAAGAFEARPFLSPADLARALEALAAAEERAGIPRPST
jgi:hypothetical protein